MQRGQERRSTRQVALPLCDTRLYRERTLVVRGNIQNLIKLSQRFGKTTLVAIGIRVRDEQLDVARVEPLSFVEGRLAPVPLASPRWWSAELSDEVEARNQ